MKRRRTSRDADREPTRAAESVGVASRPARFLVRAGAAPGERVALDAAEARHAHVRRLAVGDAIALFDGVGHGWDAVIDAWSRGSVVVRVTAPRPDRDGESSLDLTLAVALLKADKFDWLIEKVTELGVTRIRPFVSRHSLARPSAARRERWQQIALSAAKQCGRTVVPPVEAPVDFTDILRDAAPCRLLCWEGDDAEPWVPSAENATMTLVVGPEGGFAPAEVDAARAAGFRLVSLGPRILRAETAAIAAIAAIACSVQSSEFRA